MGVFLIVWVHFNVLGSGPKKIMLFKMPQVVGYVNKKKHEISNDFKKILIGFVVS